MAKIARAVSSYEVSKLVTGFDESVKRTPSAPLAPISQVHVGQTLENVYHVSDKDLVDATGNARSTLSTARMVQIVEDAANDCLNINPRRSGYTSASCALEMQMHVQVPNGCSISVALTVQRIVGNHITFLVHVANANGSGLVVATGLHNRVLVKTADISSAIERKVSTKQLALGLRGLAVHLVAERDTVVLGARAGNASTPVVRALSSPALLSWAEEACEAAVEEHLPAGSTSVGSAVSMTHTAPTALGMVVSCHATLENIITQDGKTLLFFRIEASDRDGRVMTARTERTIVRSPTDS